jgi:arylsulfatase A-like enzyme
VVAAALEFLRIHGEERWFLYLHFMDVHEYTYDQESALFGTKYADVYDNSVRFTDGTLSVLLEYLSAWGLRDNTLIAIASDHGEAFRERGFEGHARRVYRETTEVPFVVAFPFRLEPGVVIETRTRNVDVWPTLLDLVGVTPAGDGDGRSLVPDILASARGEAPPAADRTGVAHLDQHWGMRNQRAAFVVAVVDGSYRYVRTDQVGPPLEQLFDADSDPREMHDRSKQEPETLERLRGIADSSVEVSPAWGAAPTRELDELELNQLRALGYAVP